MIQYIIVVNSTNTEQLMAGTALVPFAGLQNGDEKNDREPAVITTKCLCVIPV